MPPQSSKPRLNDLPVELLSRIASYGTCSSALALLRTNRSIRDAVNDRATFKNIILNGSNLSQIETIWDPSLLTTKLSTQLWVRYAYADLKAEQFRNGPGKQSSTELATWAPQLMVMHHPLLAYPQAGSFFGHITQCPPEEALAISFCHVACVISPTFDLGGTGHSSRPQFYASICGDTPGHDRWQRLLQVETFPYLEIWPRTHQPDTHLTQLLSTVYKALPTIYYEIHRGLVADSLRRANHQDNSPEPPIPPTSAQIPWSTIMTLPFPFGADSAKQFNMCYVRNMSTVSFIKGLWNGYSLSVSERIPYGRFDRPIKDLEFVVVSLNEGTGLVTFQSTNSFRDVMGEFNTGLTFKAGDTKIEVTKRYGEIGGGGPLLNMQGLLTPFGIVATYSGTGTAQWKSADWLWLWKSEWTA